MSSADTTTDDNKAKPVMPLGATNNTDSDYALDDFEAESPTTVNKGDAEVKRMNDKADDRNQVNDPLHSAAAEDDNSDDSFDAEYEELECFGTISDLLASDEMGAFNETNSLVKAVEAQLEETRGMSSNQRHEFLATTTSLTRSGDGRASSETHGGGATMSGATPRQRPTLRTMVKKVQLSSTATKMMADDSLNLNLHTASRYVQYLKNHRQEPRTLGKLLPHLAVFLDAHPEAIREVVSVENCVTLLVTFCQDQQQAALEYATATSTQDSEAVVSSSRRSSATNDHQKYAGPICVASCAIMTQIARQCAAKAFTPVDSGNLLELLLSSNGGEKEESTGSGGLMRAYGSLLRLLSFLAPQLFTPDANGPPVFGSFFQDLRRVAQTAIKTATEESTARPAVRTDYYLLYNSYRVLANVADSLVMALEEGTEANSTRSLAAVTGLLSESVVLLVVAAASTTSVASSIDSVVQTPTPPRPPPAAVAVVSPKDTVFSPGYRVPAGGFEETISGGDISTVNAQHFHSDCLMLLEVLLDSIKVQEALLSTESLAPEATSLLAALMLLMEKGSSSVAVQAGGMIYGLLPSTDGNTFVSDDSVRPLQSLLDHPSPTPLMTDKPLAVLGRCMDGTKSEEVLTTGLRLVQALLDHCTSASTTTINSISDAVIGPLTRLCEDCNNCVSSDQLLVVASVVSKLLHAGSGFEALLPLVITLLRSCIGWPTPQPDAITATMRCLQRLASQAGYARLATRHAESGDQEQTLPELVLAGCNILSQQGCDAHHAEASAILSQLIAAVPSSMAGKPSLSVASLTSVARTHLQRDPSAMTSSQVFLQPRRSSHVLLRGGSPKASSSGSYKSAVECNDEIINNYLSSAEGIVKKHPAALDDTAVNDVLSMISPKTDDRVLMLCLAVCSNGLDSSGGHLHAPRMATSFAPVIAWLAATTQRNTEKIAKLLRFFVTLVNEPATHACKVLQDKGFVSTLLLHTAAQPQLDRGHGAMIAFLVAQLAQETEAEIAVNSTKCRRIFSDALSVEGEKVLTPPQQTFVEAFEERIRTVIEARTGDHVNTTVSDLPPPIPDKTDATSAASADVVNERHVLELEDRLEHVKRELATHEGKLERVKEKLAAKEELLASGEHRIVRSDILNNTANGDGDNNGQSGGGTLQVTHEEYYVRDIDTEISALEREEKVFSKEKAAYDAELAEAAKTIWAKQARIRELILDVGRCSKEAAKAHNLEEECKMLRNANDELKKLLAAECSVPVDAQNIAGTPSTGGHLSAGGVRARRPQSALTRGRNANSRAAPAPPPEKDTVPMADFNKLMFRLNTLNHRCKDLQRQLTISEDERTHAVVEATESRLQAKHVILTHRADQQSMEWARLRLARMEKQRESINSRLDTVEDDAHRADARHDRIIHRKDDALRAEKERAQSEHHRMQEQLKAANASIEAVQAELRRKDLIVAQLTSKLALYRRPNGGVGPSASSPKRKRPASAPGSRSAGTANPKIVVSDGEATKNTSAISAADTSHGSAARDRSAADMTIDDDVAPAMTSLLKHRVVMNQRIAAEQNAEKEQNKRQLPQSAAAIARANMRPGSAPLRRDYASPPLQGNTTKVLGASRDVEKRKHVTVVTEDFEVPNVKRGSSALDTYNHMLDPHLKGFYSMKAKSASRKGKGPLAAKYHPPGK